MSAVFRRLFACFLAAFAALPAVSSEPGRFLSTGVASRHVRRGVELSGTAWQAELEGRGEAWRGRFGSSVPFDSSEPGELQAGLGWMWSDGSTFTVVADGTHFWYLDQPGIGATSHSFEAKLDLIWSVRGGWRPGIGFAYDVRLRTKSFETSLAYDVPLARWGAFLELRARAGHATADDLLPNATTRVSDAYRYLGIDARLPYRIGAHTTIVAEAHLAATENQARAWSPVGEKSGVRSWFSIGANFDF